MNNTKTDFLKTRRKAVKVCKGLTPEQIQENRIALVKQLAKEASVHIDTAKRHIKYVVKQKENPKFRPPAWGGSRGGGRPPKKQKEE